MNPQESLASFWGPKKNLPKNQIRSNPSIGGRFSKMSPKGTKPPNECWKNWRLVVRHNFPVPHGPMEPPCQRQHRDVANFQVKAPKYHSRNLGHFFFGGGDFVLSKNMCFVCLVYCVYLICWLCLFKSNGKCQSFKSCWTSLFWIVFVVFSRILVRNWDLGIFS